VRSRRAKSLAGQAHDPRLDDRAASAKLGIAIAEHSRGDPAPAHPAS
jgi:hypothetical protein